MRLIDDDALACKRNQPAGQLTSPVKQYRTVHLGFEDAQESARVGIVTCSGVNVGGDFRSVRDVISHAKRPEKVLDCNIGCGGHLTR